MSKEGNMVEGLSCKLRNYKRKAVYIYRRSISITHHLALMDDTLIVHLLK